MSGRYANSSLVADVLAVGWRNVIPEDLCRQRRIGIGPVADVLMAQAAMANSSRLVWASLDTLSEATGLPRRVVQTATDVLRAGGLTASGGRKGRAAVTVLLVDEWYRMRGMEPPSTVDLVAIENAEPRTGIPVSEPDSDPVDNEVSRTGIRTGIRTGERTGIPVPKWKGREENTTTKPPSATFPGMLVGVRGGGGDEPSMDCDERSEDCDEPSTDDEHDDALMDEEAPADADLSPVLAVLAPILHLRGVSPASLRDEVTAVLLRGVTVLDAQTYLSRRFMDGDVRNPGGFARTVLREMADPTAAAVVDVPPPTMADRLRDSLQRQCRECHGTGRANRIVDPEDPTKDVSVPCPECYPDLAAEA